MLFNALGTQWRTGFSGPVGLDYNVLYHRLDRLKLSDADYADLEAAVRTLEDEALAVMRESREST